MTIVLAIDTATPAVTAGIVERGPSGMEVLAERVTVDPRAHAEQLTPNVLAALSDAGLAVADLGAVVIGCGPGPFTGLRVGMATAAAYGHALGIPVHGVCSLDAIGVDTTGEVLVVTDARRREVYWAQYRDGVRIGGPAVNAPSDVLAAVPTNVSAIAGSEEHAALFELPRLAPIRPTSSGLVRVADWSAPPAPLIPLYLRRPDAKPAAGGQGRSDRGDRRRRAGAKRPGDWHDAVVTVVYDSLVAGDATRCAELEAELFPGDDPWPAVAFLRELDSDHNFYVAARLDGELVGYAGISRLGRRPPYEYEVHTIGVDTRHQGKGIGRGLLDGLLDIAAGGVVFLEVRTDNAAAIALYESVGFVVAGVRKRYYRISGADAYTMRKAAT